MTCLVRTRHIVFGRGTNVVGRGGVGVCEGGGGGGGGSVLGRETNECMTKAAADPGFQKGEPT